jgi:hypothetical protein
MGQYPDAYQYERAKRFGVIAICIAHAVKRLGGVYNKTLQHPKADSHKRSTFCQMIEKHKKKGALLYSLMSLDWPTICPQPMDMPQKGS